MKRYNNNTELHWMSTPQAIGQGAHGAGGKEREEQGTGGRNDGGVLGGVHVLVGCLVVRLPRVKHDHLCMHMSRCGTWWFSVPL